MRKPDSTVGSDLNGGALRMTERVAGRLADDLGSNVDHVVRDLSDIRADLHMGFDTVRLGQLLDEAGELGAEITVMPDRWLEVEDEPAELGDGGVQALDRFFHVVTVADVVDPRGESLEHETDCKEILDDGVVEVAGDSLAVFHHRQPSQLLLAA